MPPLQVRLHPDVADFVRERAERDAISASKAASALLREQMVNGAIIAQHLTATESWNATGGNVDAGLCPHPILRRRGDKCGACGSTV